MTNSTRRLRRHLIVSTCLAVGGAGLPFAAHAQSAPKKSTVEVEQVVVTAERRTADIQRSPLAITAVGAKALDQSFITTLAGLNGVAPSLEITKASGFENLVTIRGVGSETPENSLTTVPGVSLFIDGVYIANTIALDQTLFDIKDIQVLRGPQGALYGQSSIGGAIIVETRQPKLHSFDGSGDVSIGDYNLHRERAEANLPLGDDFAARLSLQKFDHDGFTKDAALAGFDLDDAHDASGKLALLWKPTDAFSAVLAAQLYRADQHGDAQKNIADPSPDPRVVNQDYPAHFKLTTQLYHLNMDWRLPLFDLKSVTAYQVLEHVQQEDDTRSTFALLGTYNDLSAWNTTVRNFTQEFDVLSKTGGALEWVAGLFYLNQTSHQFIAEFSGATAPTPANLAIPPTIETAPPANLQYGNNSNAAHQSYSAFAQVTYHVTPSLRLTAGGRINVDHNQDPSTNFSGVNFGGGPGHNTSSRYGRWDDVPTWRFEADYDFTGDNMIYASVTRGYKPGGVNGSTGQYVVLPTFKPETNDAFEVGSKNFLFDRSLRLNVSAFYYLQKNFQYIETDPIPFQGGISNIPSVHDYGVEFEAAYVGLDKRLRVNASLALEKGYVDGHYKTIDSTVANALEGPNNTGANSLPFFGPCAFSGAYYNPACWAAVAASAIDIKGKAPPATPEVSGSVSASYRFDVPMGALTPRIEYIYRGAEWARVFNDAGLDRVKAYDVVNLNAEYALADSGLRLVLTAANVFNTAGVNSQYTNPYGSGQTSRQFIPPRQIIGTIAYSF